MPEDLPEVLTEKTQVSFSVPKSGLYAISVTARCKGKNDLRVQIDERLFREIPPEKNIQKYDIPPAWNGSKLQGLKQTNINRLKKSRSNWGRSIHEIILKEYQYDAFWNEKTFDKVRDPLNHVAKEEWEKCYKIAEVVIKDKEKDPASGATHFYSTAIDTGFPWWATEETYRAKIGITYFYELES